MRRIRFELAPRTEDSAVNITPRPRRGRSPVLAEAFARLEIAEAIDDPDAAFRILTELRGTREGEWLLQVMASVTLSQLADHVRNVPRQRET
jgi:hypothetical protein